MLDKLNFVSSQIMLYKSLKNYGTIIYKIVVVPFMNVKFPYVIALCYYNAYIATF